MKLLTILTHRWDGGDIIAKTSQGEVRLKFVAPVALAKVTDNADLTTPIAEMQATRLKAALTLWSSDRSISMQDASFRCGLGKHAIWNSRKTNPKAFANARAKRASIV